MPYRDIITQRYNMRRHSTIRASPMDAIAGHSPTYAETMKCIVDASKRAYGGLEVDRVQPGFSSNNNRVLSIGGLVRTLIINSAANKAPLDVQGRGRYSFRWCRRACFGLFLADFGLFLANFRSLGGVGAHLDVRHWPLFAALREQDGEPLAPLSLSYIDR